MGGEIIGGTNINTKGIKLIRSNFNEMKSLIETLDNIDKLDLSKFPVCELYYYLNQIGPSVQIVYTLHPGFTILRARPNKNDSEVFSYRYDLSYKPQFLNKEYQRASTPDNTMFYGSITPPEVGSKDFDIPRMAAMLEAASTFRNNLFTSNEKITFSRWTVQEDLKLMLVLPVTEDDKSDSFVGFMNSELDRIKTISRDLSIQTRLINQFFGHQFGRSDIRFHYDYLISAMYTEIIRKQGFDGIIYPSVKAQGKGYNICISSKAVDSKLKLTSAGESRILKVGYMTEVINETECIIEDDSKPFVLQKIASYRKPDEVIKKLYTAYT